MIGGQMSNSKWAVNGKFLIGEFIRVIFIHLTVTCRYNLNIQFRFFSVGVWIEGKNPFWTPTEKHCHWKKLFNSENPIFIS